MGSQNDLSKTGYLQVRAKRDLKVRLKALSPEAMCEFRARVERLWAVLDRDAGRTQPFVGETGDLLAVYDFITAFEALEQRSLEIMV